MKGIYHLVKCNYYPLHIINLPTYLSYKKYNFSTLFYKYFTLEHHNIIFSGASLILPRIIIFFSIINKNPRNLPQGGCTPNHSSRKVRESPLQKSLTHLSYFFVSNFYRPYNSYPKF